MAIQSANVFKQGIEGELEARGKTMRNSAACETAGMTRVFRAKETLIVVNGKFSSSAGSKTRIRKESNKKR